LVPPEPTPQAGTPGSSRSTNLPPSTVFAHDESSSAVVVEKFVLGIERGGEHE
jgi:hypothetical protein